MPVNLCNARTALLHRSSIDLRSLLMRQWH
nr:MAG TPA: hypothetical protein [Bacteriophage sp.]